MKINVLETHDRYEHVIKDQWEAISKGAEDYLLRNPYSISLQDKSPYIYIWAHARKTDDLRNERLLWQARLSRPKPDTNSFLFRALSKTDIIEVCWIIPKQEMWGQFEKGFVAESNICAWSIEMFKNHYELLAKSHPDDLEEEQGKKILQSVLNEHKQEIKRKKGNGLLIESGIEW
jgi:hypothetical protein